MKLLAIMILIPAVAYADEAAAPALEPAPHALVVHVPPATSPIGEPITLEAMLDAPYAEALTVTWHAIGERAWHDEPFERSSAGPWYATLPPAAAPGVEYFIHGRDTNGGDVAHFASAQAPQVIAVEPSLVDRLEEIDRARESDLRNHVALDVIEHDFGNRYDLADHFARGELTYTHEFWRVLHSIGFGFGDVSGRTPLMSAADAETPLHASRYGFGEMRLRLHPSVFIDGRAGMAVSQNGFGGTVRGQLTFGKPWRSCVQVGIDYLSDLGPTAWVRLQWDTAPPVLMGASVVRTDLPGAVLSRFGVYLAYDVGYRITPRVSVKAQVSYGPRDGSAHVGGGLGTALSF
jgi:hypothetical protein